MDNAARVLALDIESIQHVARGQKVINALLSSKGKLYRTKRGHLAVQIPPATVARLTAQLKFTLVEGHDGTQIVELADIAAAPESPPLPTAA
jgi:hypothetical protein